MNRQQLQVVRVVYPNQGFDSALTAAQNQQLLVHSIIAVNGTAAANDLGVGHSVIGAFSTQDGLISSFPATLIGTTNGDYLQVDSEDKFESIMFNVTQAVTGSPVYTYEYWNGVAYAALTMISIPDLTTTGIKILLFSVPSDWSVDSNSAYSVRITATTAPTLALISSSVKAVKILSYREEVKPKGELLVRFDERQLLLQASAELIGFFAFASSSNTMEASYQISP